LKPFTSVVSCKDVFIKNILICIIVAVEILIIPTAYSIQVIANANVTSLTKSQLQGIFLMRQLYWPDKQKIVVFVLPHYHSLHQDFSKKTLSILPYKLDQKWNKLIYSGLGTGPIVVQSRQALIDVVMSTVGAIGYAEDKAAIKDKYVIKITH